MNWVVGYLMGALIWAILSSCLWGATHVTNWAGQAETMRDRRRFARAFWLSPVWVVPVLGVCLLVLGKLWKDAWRGK